MLALRLTRGAHPAVQLRRLLVTAASAGTGFLLLCALGYAIGHPGDPSAAALRLAWCATPLAATVHFALAVARTDPATKPRPGLSALGLGPARLMAVSATTTALSCALGSMLALLVFLHLRGDLTGMPFDGAAAEALAAHRPLPLPAALTLLLLVPAIASAWVAADQRPRRLTPGSRTPGAPAAGGTPRPRTRVVTYGGSGTGGTFGSYGRFGAHFRPRPSADPEDGHPVPAPSGHPVPAPSGHPGATSAAQPADMRAARPSDASASRPAGALAAQPADGGEAHATDGGPTPPTADAEPTAPREAPRGLPWGIAVLAAGLAVEAYTSKAAGAPGAPLPGGQTAAAPSVLVGWLLTALGLALAGPGLTHLCGRLLQAVRPGARRLLAGRILMAEATRLGRPLGVVCAVASAAYAMAALYGGTGTAPSFGPLTALGGLLVTGCTVATLLTAAVEAKHARADTTAALLRLGAPTTMLRGAAALRAGALLALFGPLTLFVAELAALPLAS